MDASFCSNHGALPPAPPRGAWRAFSARRSAKRSAIACVSTIAISARTRIEVVTEGVFARMILDDPELSGHRRGALRRIP